MRWHVCYEAEDVERGPTEEGYWTTCCVGVESVEDDLSFFATLWQVRWSAQRLCVHPRGLYCTSWRWRSLPMAPVWRHARHDPRAKCCRNGIGDAIASEPSLQTTPHPLGCSQRRRQPASAKYYALSLSVEQSALASSISHGTRSNQIQSNAVFASALSKNASLPSAARADMHYRTGRPDTARCQRRFEHVSRGAATHRQGLWQMGIVTGRHCEA